MESSDIKGPSHGDHQRDLLQSSSSKGNILPTERIRKPEVPPRPRSAADQIASMQGRFWGGGSDDTKQGQQLEQWMENAILRRCNLRDRIREQELECEAIVKKIHGHGISWEKADEERLEFFHLGQKAQLAVLNSKNLDNLTEQKMMDTLNNVENSIESSYKIINKYRNKLANYINDIVNA